MSQATAWQFTPNAASTFLGGAGGLFGSGVAESGGDSASGWAAANVRLAFPIKLNSRATLTPYVAVNMPMGALSTVVASSGDQRVRCRWWPSRQCLPDRRRTMAA
jgi:hypothetical protein